MYYLFIIVILEVRPKAFPMLGKGSTTRLCLQPLESLFLFVVVLIAGIEIGSYVVEAGPKLVTLLLPQPP